MFLFTLFLGFLVGVLTIIAVEAVGMVFIIGRLSRKSKAAEEKASREISHLDLSADPSVYYDKQGVVWVLEPEKVPKSLPVDKVRREQKRKKEIFEVIPVRKYAQIKDQSLILTESDSSHTEIHLKDCTITAVSATALSSRKWAKRYPIKVESRTSVLYNGSKTAYIYLETSWEKESWCKALRLASCNDTQKLEWFSKTILEFQNYLTTLNTGYPSFMKPSVGFNSEPIDRSVKLDGSSSKVRLFLKKFAKKASKTGVENKMSWTLPSGREERKFSEKNHSFQDSVLGTGVGKTASVRKASNFPAEDKIVPSLSTLSHTSSRSHVSTFSDADSDDKIGSDEGTLCWNLLISRLFFDAKGNTEMKKILQARIQRTLSNTRTPSYIGDLICTGIDLGTLPPCISGMRVLPLDMNEVWALEIDIQYSGGALLDIKTRLKVREPDFEKGIMDTNLESSSDLLEGFEYYSKQLELSGGTFHSTEGKVEADSLLDGMKSCKSTNKAPRWKSILNSVAKQVSQVPLSLAVRVASLRGTLRLHIKPPPSDQLWFGFTSMPDIDFNLESCVGEHKIKSGHIAMFLINRFKAIIREAVVLPNCENVCIPWMLAEKDDWVPLEAAPYIWINHEAAVDTTTAREMPSSPMAIDASWETTTSSDFPEAQPDKGKNVGCFQQQSIESSYVACAASSSNLINESPWSSSKSLQELSTPLLSNGEQPQATCEEGSKEQRTHPEFDRSPSDGSFTSSTVGEQIELMEGDDVSVRPKRMAGTRAKMLGLGKKMGEKLEEKRRNIEEKGRHIVERMRGPPPP